MAHLSKRLRFDLTDPFSGDVELEPDLFERLRFPIKKTEP